MTDDQRVVREGLATIVGALPGTEVVGLAADGAEAVHLAETCAPDVVLMDLRMPVLDGVAATARIRRERPGTAVVVLTTYADDESILAALPAGALGYLTKDATRDDIRRALEAAAAGQSVLDPAASAALVQAARAAAASVAPSTSSTSSTSPTSSAGGPVAGASPPQVPPSGPPAGLTDREAEVLGLIGAGLSNQEIGRRLFVLEATVKTHINRIFAKTASRDRAQAAAFAFRHGLVPDTGSPR